jgi:hypothetical protein
MKISIDIRNIGKKRTEFKNKNYRRLELFQLIDYYSSEEV